MSRWLPNPRPLIAILTLLVPAFAFAEQQPEPLTAAEVLRLAPESSSAVLDARNSVSGAERELAILEADPQALPIDVAAARRDVEAAEDELRSALARSRTEALGHFADLLEADASLRQAELSAEIADVSLQATRTRYSAGAATALEVSEAENERSSALRTLQEAQIARQFALESLEGFLNRPVAAVVQAGEEDLQPVPDIDEVFARLEGESGRLRSAARAVASAEEQLAAVDNAFTPRRQVENAREALENARLAAEETQGSVRLAVRQALASLNAARNRFENARANLEAATDNHRAQEARFEAGTISAIALDQSRLSLLGSQASLAGALHALLNAQLQLEVVVLE